MHIAIYTPPSSAKMEAVAEGFRAHGLSPELRNRNQYSPTDMAVLWGHKTPHVLDGQRAAGADYLVVELAYFGDRIQWISLGLNGLNGRAQMYNRNCPPDRWEKYGVEVKPWKAAGEYVLVMGQIPGDVSLQKCRSRQLPGYIPWLADACKRAKCYGLPVYFRPHPRMTRPFAIDCPVMNGSLEEALSRAALVISWNSNSLVDAVLAGVPIVACDNGSMAYEMGVHEIGEDPIRPVRDQWLYDMAYSQWTLNEVRTGEAWGHLKQRYA